MTKILARVSATAMVATLLLFGCKAALPPDVATGDGDGSLLQPASAKPGAPRIVSVSSTEYQLKYRNQVQLMVRPPSSWGTGSGARVYQVQRSEGVTTTTTGLSTSYAPYGDWTNMKWRESALHFTSDESGTYRSFAPRRVRVKRGVFKVYVNIPDSPRSGDAKHRLFMVRIRAVVGSQTSDWSRTGPLGLTSGTSGLYSGDTIAKVVGRSRWNLRIQADPPITGTRYEGTVLLYNSRICYGPVGVMRGIRNYNGTLDFYNRQNWKGVRIIGPGDDRAGPCTDVVSRRRPPGR